MKLSLNGKLALSFVLIILISTFIGGFNAGYKVGYKKAERELRQRGEQIIESVESTIKVEPIVFTKLETKKVYHRDTVRIPVLVEQDPDTVYVSVPREVKVYEDSLYRAVVSGISPALDTLTLYRPYITKTITLTSKPKPYKWSIGVHAGYGAFAHNGTIALAPHIGVGVSYNFIRF